MFCPKGPFDSLTGLVGIGMPLIAALVVCNYEKCSFDMMRATGRSRYGQKWLPIVQRDGGHQSSRRKFYCHTPTASSRMDIRRPPHRVVLTWHLQFSVQGFSERYRGA